MKRIPLFWKIWLLCESTIIVTAIVCLVTLIWIVPWINATQRVAQSEQNIALLTEMVTTDAIDKQKITNQMEFKGYVVSITAGGENIYVSEGIEVNTVLAMVTKTNLLGYTSGLDMLYDLEAEHELIPIDVSLIFGGYKQFNAEVVKDGQTYSIVLLDPGMLADDMEYIDFDNVANQIQSMTVVLITGLVVATIFSFLIARFITKRVKRLNVTAKQMENFEIEVRTENKPGDELVQLENSIYQMYGKLRLTIAELDDEMQQNLQLETDKQVFMRGATHELKTPLMALSSMVEGMMNDIPAFEDRDYYLQRCAEYIEKMQVLVNEILDVSRIEHVQSEESTEIALVINEHIALYSELNERTKIHFYNEADMDKKINMPYNYFQKIVSNLMSNAVLYHKAESEIVVRLDDESLSFSNQYATTADLETEQLFKPFESSTASGHGLGLYIVKLFLERYQINFRLDIDNDAQVFTFTIDL